MPKLDYNKFLPLAQKAKTEEDIKAVYAKTFDIQYDTADKHDLYTPQVLFEFKFDKALDNLKTRATVLAQILYYVRRLKYGAFTDKPIPNALCLADQDEAILTETVIWREYYSEQEGKYDWDLAPSNPDATLIKDLTETKELKNVHIYKIQEKAEFEVFADLLTKHLQNQLTFTFTDKKVINEANFENVFVYWNRIFGDAVRNGLKTSRYFVCDIQQGSTIYIKDESKVIFQFAGGDAKIKKILARDYEHFWGLYERVTNPDDMRGILAKIDRLTDDTMRRFHGEFFTPVAFAQKALAYIERTLGKHWWTTGNYRLWDMATGTGNLEYHLPQEALPYCYLSTLYMEDVEHCKRLFADATIFQYDYLNDDVDNLFLADGALPFALQWKLPARLRQDLQNPAIKWIILINPPFATSQTAGTNHSNSKQGVSDTNVRKIMHKAELGETSRELFVQFLFRIKKEFAGKEAHLGIFSTIKYLNANNDQILRDKIFQFQFEAGFAFSSANFSGTSKASPFPIGFLLWNLNVSQHIATQNIALDVFNEKVEKISVKTIATDEREKHLSKWIKRPPATIQFPPFGSAIEVKAGNKDRRDRIAKDFLASLMCGGNDFQHQGLTSFLSGPYVSAGALSVTPDNFEEAMVVHAVRRIPKATWLNDRDQFLQPNAPLPAEFISDCAVWNLFSNSNATAALKDVVYEGKTYQVHNHFFPFPVAEIKKWKITDSDIALSLATAQDTYMCTWLGRQAFSPEAQAVLQAGKELYKVYFASLNEMRTPKFKIHTWDAGWWQIRNAMADVHLEKEAFEALKALHNTLKEKILPEIGRLGFV